MASRRQWQRGRVHFVGKAAILDERGRADKPFATGVAGEAV
jgi:hypothetical protein